ncbi:MAG: arylsulfatase [Cyclobacteriaceae bacterium]|nr:arylsulfatase [Cyclobacteriaceae bacterium]
MKFIHGLLICVAGFQLLSCETDNTHPPRPNIVLILVDDMGYSDLGSFGSEISTPHLDQLAASGIRFTQFTNAAKCFPSRACLLTGLYAQQCGMAHRADTLRNSVTLGEVLQNSGYRTLMSGKHHGKENMYFRGFDRYYGLRDGASNHFNPGKQRPGEPVPAHKVWAQPRAWCIDDSTHLPYHPVPDDFYTTDYFTYYAIDYLQEYKDEDKPFFLFLSYTAPHDPLQAWPEDIAKYKGVYDAGYEQIRRQRYERMKELGIIDDSFPLSNATYEKWDEMDKFERTEEIQRMQVYAAMIDRVDMNIGRLIETLKSIGKYDNTIIMFASDNGGSPGIFPSDGEGYNEWAGLGIIGSMERWTSLGTSWSNVCNTPYRYYKDWSHHGGTCTPFIIHWPGNIQPGISDYPGHFIDFMPTFIEWSGAEYPLHFKGDTIPAMAGESFAAVLHGEKKDREKPLFWEFQNGKAVRKGHYRLVWESFTEITDPLDYAEGPDDGQGYWALYDMRHDKTETKNIADQHPDIVNEMKALYASWAKDMARYPQLEMATIRR